MSTLPATSSRHKWTPLRKTYGSNESICERCKLVKIGRFSRGTHWNEWQRNGKYIEAEGTPPCETQPGAHPHQVAAREAA